MRATNVRRSAVPTMGDAILFRKLHLNVISQAAVVVLCPQLPHTRQAHEALRDSMHVAQ